MEFLRLTQKKTDNYSINGLKFKLGNNCFLNFAPQLNAEDHNEVRDNPATGETVCVNMGCLVLEICQVGTLTKGKC